MKKTITLSIKERIQLINIMPGIEGRKIEVITLNTLLKMVTFTSDEIAEFKLRDMPDGSVQWNPKFSRDVVFELTDEQAAMLKKTMTIVENKGGFKIDLLPLDTKISTL